MAKFIIAACLPHCVESHGRQEGPVTYWGGLTPAQHPAVHSCLGDAQFQAEKLARAEPTKAFIIFQAIEARQATSIKVTPL